MKGLVHIYTGNGKGKTTAALGLGIRACGRGLKVLMFQFLKGSETGEIAIINKLEPDFTLKRGNEIKKFTWNMNEEEKKEARVCCGELLNEAVDASLSNAWDLIILDEVMAAITSGFIDLSDAIDLIRNKPQDLEIVLTGRNAPKELIEVADYVSEINAIKHPMDRGIPARIGIEW